MGCLPSRETFAGSRVFISKRDKMNYDAITEVLTTGMVEFYKDQIRRLEDLQEVYEKNLKELKEERVAMIRHLERVEDYALMHEMRANAMHDLINHLIDSSTNDVRQDINEAVEYVARIHDVNLDFDFDPFSEEELSDIFEF